jgi:hypothetical protein
VARIRIDPRVIHVEHGWWFQKGGARLRNMEINVNLLTDNQPPYDPAMEPISCEATLQGQRHRMIV